MNSEGTVAGAQEYWRRYYAEQFRFGLGTEDILAALMRIPPVTTWADLGCGSESMLWATALRAQRLVAVDIDTQRLEILRQFVTTAQPRGIHVTALELCGRTDPDAFEARCRSLTALIQADCLSSQPPTDPRLIEQSFNLVTQFGLLGLCRDANHFTTSFAHIHRLQAPGGWVGGANWVARHAPSRVELTRQLYTTAATRAGVHLLLLKRIPSPDPDFTAVWIYIGRKTPCPRSAPLTSRHPTN
ncbi:class I SAM-dependent methyltransferase [Saccharopolyspora spinosa]|uniref:Methyltransferase family protein n=1 Tax=Saccharopolyspora spinosa TaxID=60894 RepID=A0A2N3XUX6_SACSN|nr:class I SAM-dependent methyltransferase [Saccharopolyspora spinosa]PKW14493.1 hypothetical protein A8926_2113 [Saccharopolyspora spinosa]